MKSQRVLIWAAVSTTQQADDDRVSLAVQEADALAWADKQGWRVVDILRVPGHSRAYIDIHKAAADMRTVGIDAFDKLMQHWEAQDFDILICRDGTRFARTQSLHAYVVERTIEIGARIYSLSERLMVDESNYRMWTSMGGFAAAGEVDQFKRRTKMGKDGRVMKRGLSTNGLVPRSHRAIRDPGNGKIIGVELNPDTAQEWQDLAALLLEGVPLSRLGDEMFLRFGYATDRRAHTKAYYHIMLYTPAFWGHTTRYYHRSAYHPGVFMDDVPLPAPGLINRYTHEPVYQGELASAVKAELMRRVDMHGRAFAGDTHRLSGMLNCDYCGYRLMYNSQHSSKYRYLVCISKQFHTADVKCETSKRVQEDVYIKQIDLFLDGIRATGEMRFEFEPGLNLDTLKADISKLEQDIAGIENQIRVLIGKQATSPANVSDLYDESIETLSGQLDGFRQRYFNLSSKLKSEDFAGQQETVQQLRAMTSAEFWSQDSRVINQQLHALMGKARFMVRDGEIVGIKIPERQRGNRIRDRKSK